jgi:hypothetical protein
MTTPQAEGSRPSSAAEESGASPPDWWQSDHPTFTAIAGFFTGLLFVTVIPGGCAGLLRLLFHYHTAERLFPFVAVFLVIPIGLVIAPRTRRFGKYMLLGMALTALVVLGVASLVLYFMVRADA